MSAAALLAVALVDLRSGRARPPRLRRRTTSSAYKLGLRAYKYGLPLLTTQQTYRTATSVNKPTHRAYAPPNRFSQAHKLANPNARTVVAPNHDTLYSIGWLNLKRQPVVIHVPKVRGPLLRLRAGRPIHDQLPQPRHRQPHQAGRLRRRAPAGSMFASPRACTA